MSPEDDRETIEAVVSPKRPRPVMPALRGGGDPTQPIEPPIQKVIDSIPRDVV